MELGKLQLVGITTDEEDISSGARTKVTSVLCFRVDANAVTGGVAKLAPGIAATFGVALLVVIVIAGV